MFGLNKKKKSATLKIPSGILKKEAQKLAKQMLQKEEQKDRQKEIKERAKDKAKNKLEKQKAEAKAWEEHYEPLRKEITGGAFILFGLSSFAILFSQAPLATALTQTLQELLGMGIWILPLSLIGFGIALIQSPQTLFPPQRIAALLGSFCFFLGGLNLLTPLQESLELAPRYGGALGFALGFFPREYLGEVVSWILILGGFVMLSMVGVGVGFTHLWDVILGQKEMKKSTKRTISKTEEENLSPSLPSRFKNELEIIDTNRRDMDQTEDDDLSLELGEAEDELTRNKNQTFQDHFEPPSLDLLNEGRSTITVNEADLRDQAEAIRIKLEQFGLEVTMKSVHVGPTVTQFTLEPSPGVKLTKITALRNDLALALAAPSLRIEAPIRGKKLVGIEIPNTERATVTMREILESEAWDDSTSPLTIILGRDVTGKPMVADLQRMPHLLIAGKTGSGKSVAMNAFLISLLWRNTPKELRLILIDPKRVELKPYDHLPHLLTPVITEPEKAVSSLAWAVAEMNRRYRKLSEEGVRNLGEYNQKHSDEPEPYIVIVIDELADLMMTAGKDVEAAVCRIAQMARAVGMHLIVATQRPSVDVVTGLIKANLPARIAFRVNSGIDSRTIIDGIGAEDLLGFGDMLSLDGNSGELTRIQGVYLSTEEVERVTNHIKIQFPEMIANDEITEQSIEGMAKGGVLTAGLREDIKDEDLDELFQEAVEVVLETGKASASFLQRRFEIGYARAARLLDQMEKKRIIGPAKGAKAREIYGRG